MDDDLKTRGIKYLNGGTWWLFAFRIEISGYAPARGQHFRQPYTKLYPLHYTYCSLALGRWQPKLPCAFVASTLPCILSIGLL